MKRQSGKKLLAAMALFTMAWLLLPGCVSMGALRKSESEYYQGRFSEAAAVFGDGSELEADSGAVLPNLYRGSACFMAGDFAGSFAAFACSEAGMQEQDAALNWGKAYIGRTYDGIMANTYQALDLLAMGRYDDARVAFNRLEMSQGKAAQRNLRAIEKKKRAAEEQSSESDASGYVGAVTSNPDNERQLREFTHLADMYGAYADYENPASRLVSGLYRLLYGEDRDDAEKAVFQMRKAYGMTQATEVANALAIAEAAAEGRTKDGRRFTRASLSDFVFVVFENGLGVTKEEKRIELVIPYRGSVLYAGIALPMLVERQAAYPCLSLFDQNTFLKNTAPFCSLDRIAATEFRKELPGIIAAEVTEAVIKVVLQAAAIETARKNAGDGMALLTGIVGSVAAAATTSADVRNWNFLPKEYQFCVVSRPRSGVLTIAVPPSNARLVDLPMPQSGPAFVFVKIPFAGARPVCMVFEGYDMRSVSKAEVGAAKISAFDLNNSNRLIDSGKKEKMKE